MNGLVIANMVLLFAGSAWAQYAPARDSGDGLRRAREVSSPAPPGRGPISVRPSARSSKRSMSFRDMIREANDLNRKIQSLGSWEEQHEKFAQDVEGAFAEFNLDTETDQVMKRLLIETHKHPPHDFNARVDTVADIVAERYGFDDKVKNLTKRLIRGQTFKLMMKYGPKLLPLAKEVINMRANGEPFTAEKIAEWSRKFRPMLEEAYRDTLKQLEPHIRTLAPEQQAKIRGDLRIVDKRMKTFQHQVLGNWERGNWVAADWGLQNDPIQTGQVAAAKARKREAQRNRFLEKRARANALTGRRPRGPMRIGDTGGRVQGSSNSVGAGLPDETLWVNYVKQFCKRYNLDTGQKASAHAILKGLQKQARAYRDSRGDEIKRIQKQMEGAEPADRSALQGELRDLLSPVDALFDELKARLESIPREDQVSRGGR